MQTSSDRSTVAGALGAPTTNVVSHARTGTGGTFEIAPPPATTPYSEQGRLHCRNARPASATVTAGAVTNQSFTLPAPGAIHVLVTDETNAPIPAKVQLVGFDPSPDPRNSQSILGLINTNTGVFNEQFEDAVQYGIANVTFADKNGDTGVFQTEPGTYQLVVSRGPRYSAFTQSVTLTAGSTLNVNAQIAKVVPTPGFILGDFHVHGILSPDSEVTQVERITTQIADGNDFFTPSEHEIRADYSPFIYSMGVENLIATAPSAEITTFDYGHFNSWPVTIDANAVNGGTVDWGRAGVPPGQDFPSYGNYNLTPGEIYAAAHADPKANLIQINHMRSHFNTDGLDIDTAENDTGPPQSHTLGASRRLIERPELFRSGFDALGGPTKRRVPAISSTSPRRTSATGSTC